MKTIKRVLLSGMTLASLGLFAQSPKSDFIDKNIDTKPLKWTNFENSYAERSASRSTSCSDTSWYPRIQSDSLHIYNLQPSKSGDQAAGQVYSNSADINIKGVNFWTNAISSEITVKAQVWNAENNGPTTLISETDAAGLTSPEGVATINFASPVNVTGDFMIAISFESSTDTSIFPMSMDYNDGEGLAYLLQTSDNKWLGINPDSLGAKFNISPSAITDNFHFMIFPVFETSLAASYTSDQTTLDTIVAGTTVTFTGDITAPSLADSMISYSYYAQRPSNYSWFVVNPSDTTILLNDDTSANLSYTFDSTGTYWVDLWAVSAKWTSVFTGQYAQCQDILNKEIVVIADDTDNAIEEMNSNLTLYTAYPNPAEDMVTINFNMINTDQVDIQIFNINGEMVYNYNDRMNFGQNRVVINTQEFSNGTYYYSVQTANSVLTSKFIIQK